jgi:electron transfer flavoprotein alpha subunit
MSIFSTVWVFSDDAARLPGLIAEGARFGEKVAAFVLGSDDDAKASYAHGADAVYHLGEKDPSRIVEDYAQTLAGVIAQGPGKSLVLLAGTRCGKALGALLGVRLEAGVVSEANEISLTGEHISAKHMVYGGLAVGEDKILSPIAVVVFAGSAPEMAAPLAAKTGSPIPVAFAAPATPVRCLERRKKKGSSVDLSQAKRIVAVGRGFAAEADLSIARELSAALEAEVGCSRPIAEAEKWMERACYIGISGVMPKPEIYLALGISGQIQHMVGAGGAQTIVAVNKDKNAPIFQFADYGIVGDLYKVVPALTKALQG